jgi:hypothetical protein
MAGRECYHCKQWVEAGAAHDCWTTTEAALTRDLSEDLREAWERLRETAVAFGDQRIYASHNSIMFSRRSCYFFVRPKRNFLEVCVFLGRAVKAPQVRRADRSSKSKFVNIIQIRHRDEVEPPMTDWLEEAYGLSEAQAQQKIAKTSFRRKPAATLPANRLRQGYGGPPKRESVKAEAGSHKKKAGSHKKAKAARKTGTAPRRSR